LLISSTQASLENQHQWNLVPKSVNNIHKEKGIINSGPEKRFLSNPKNKHQEVAKFREQKV
jgi:hypothetical protein